MQLQRWYICIVVDGTLLTLPPVVVKRVQTCTIISAKDVSIRHSKVYKRLCLSDVMQKILENKHFGWQCTMTVCSVSGVRVDINIIIIIIDPSCIVCMYT